MPDHELTLFQGIAGDRNHLGLSGAEAVATTLAKWLNCDMTVIGTPRDLSSHTWERELELASAGLLEMSERYNDILSGNRIPITAMPRCAVGLATLPVIARYHPEASIVWFDAHADLNTPDTSETGYLGGMVIAGAAGLWNSGLGSGVDLSNVILAGLHDSDPGEQELVKHQNIISIHPDQDFAVELRKAVAGRPVYIHIDCDVLDAGLVPAEFQVTGGISLNELLAAAEVLAESEILGLEIAEFQSAWHADGDNVTPDRFLETLRPILTKFQQS